MKLQYKKTASGLGQTIDRTIVHDCDMITQMQVTIPKGLNGVLSTRTDNTHGILTMSDAHNLHIASGGVLDLFYTGMTPGQTQITVTDVVNHNVIHFTTGSTQQSPWTLPVLSTAIVTGPRYQVRLPLGVNYLSLLAIQFGFNNVSVDPLTPCNLLLVADDGTNNPEDSGAGRWDGSFVANELKVFAVENDPNFAWDDEFEDLFGTTVGWGFASNGSATDDAVLSLTAGYDSIIAADAS